MFDDILGPREEDMENELDDIIKELGLEEKKSKEKQQDKQSEPDKPDETEPDNPDETELDLDLNGLEMDEEENMKKSDPWGSVDTSNNAEPPDNDDCDGSCDGCGC